MSVPGNTRHFNPEKTRIFWADLIRIAAIFGVVLIHVASDVITEWKTVPGTGWLAANFYDSLMRACVPLFFMISGALLLPGRESYGIFFRKRVKRIAIPLIAWNILFLVWKKAFYQPELGWSEALSLLGRGGVFFHLWFLYTLIGLYLLTPFFRIVTAHASRRDLFYFLVLWFLAGSLLPTTEKFLSLVYPLDFHFGIALEPATGAVGYFLLGHFLDRYVTEKALPAACLAWILSLAACFYGTFFLCRYCGGFETLFYGSFAPNVVVYSVASFILMRSAGNFLEKRIPPGTKVFIGAVAKASFGIYLVHPIVLDLLQKGRLGFALKPELGQPSLAIPAISLLAFALSLGFVLLIEKIPGVRKIV
jgi:surface polysaccharide O-acyltransferase-like enzyme